MNPLAPTTDKDRSGDGVPPDTLAYSLHSVLESPSTGAKHSIAQGGTHALRGYKHCVNRPVFHRLLARSYPDAQTYVTHPSTRRMEKNTLPAPNLSLNAHIDLHGWFLTMAHNNGMPPPKEKSEMDMPQADLAAQMRRGHSSTAGPVNSPLQHSSTTRDKPYPPRCTLGTAKHAQ